MSIDHAEVVRLVKEGGETYAALGRRFGVSRQMIHIIIAAKAPELLRPRRKKRCRLTDAEIVKSYIEENLSIRELANKLKVSAKTIQSALTAERPDLPRVKGRRRRIDYAEAAELYKSGMPLSQVGKRYGVSVEAVRLALLSQDKSLLRGRGREVAACPEIIKRFKEGGHTYTSLAREMGLKPGFVRSRILAEAPELAADKELRWGEDKKEIIRLWRTGDYTYSALARKMGMKPQHVRQMIMQAVPELASKPRWQRVGPQMTEGRA